MNPSGPGDLSFGNNFTAFVHSLIVSTASHKLESVSFNLGICGLLKKVVSIFSLGLFIFDL